MMMMIILVYSPLSQVVVFYWSLSDGITPQVSRTLLSILVDLNNFVIRMVSILPLIPISTNFSQAFEDNSKHSNNDWGVLVVFWLKRLTVES